MRRLIFACVAIAGLFFFAGCKTPAQTLWAPGGSKAAFIPSDGGKLMIFDDTGKVISTLNNTGGGLAWTRDSSRLYCAQQYATNVTVPAVETVNHLKNVDAETTALTTRPAGDAAPAAEDQQAVIGAWQDGKFTGLLSLGNQVVCHMALSPDQNWLAIVSLLSDDKKSGDHSLSCVYAFCLRTRRLHLLALGGYPEGMAFTSDHRLAYLEPLNVNHGQASAVGQVIEVGLDDAAEEMQREEVMAIVMERTQWMAAVVNDLYFTAQPVTLPTTNDEAEGQSMRLYKYTRADKSIKPVVAEVGPFFAPNRDGKLIMFEKMGKTPAGEDRDELAVVEAATGAVHVLGPARVSGASAAGNKANGLVAFAAWRGDDQISFVTPIGAAATAKAAVVTIADMDSLEVETDVSESNLERVKKDQPCEIQLDAFPNSRFSGYVHTMVPTADRTKATVLVKVSFNNKDPRVLPEMSAKVAFLSRPIAAGEERPFVAVNRSAIATKKGKKTVFVVTENRAVETTLETGPTLGEMTEIKIGVKPGAQVVLNPPDRLRNGSRVKILEK